MVWTHKRRATCAHSSLHQFIMHPSRRHLQQRFRLAHEDYFGTTPLQSVSWCFEHHEDKYQSMTIKATLSINLTHRKRSLYFLVACIWLSLGTSTQHPAHKVNVFFSVLGRCCDPRRTPDGRLPGKLRRNSPPLSELGQPYHPFSAGAPHTLCCWPASSTKHYKV